MSAGLQFLRLEHRLRSPGPGTRSSVPAALLLIPPDHVVPPTPSQHPFLPSADEGGDGEKMQPGARGPLSLLDFVTSQRGHFGEGS